MSSAEEEEIKRAIESATQRIGYDPETLASILSAPPFIPVEGVINLRDVGGVPIPVLPPNIPYEQNTRAALDSRYLFKPAALFRSGELTRITPEGFAKLRDELHVTTIFDLRSSKELERAGETKLGIGKAGEVAVAGPTDAGKVEKSITVVRAPVAREESIEFDPVVMERRVQLFETNEEEAFASMYSDILVKGAPAFKTVLLHLRDKPNEPCLVHCTAGKDRTGLIVAIVLLLLGATDEAIIKDYTLTTAGLQQTLPFLIARFKGKPGYSQNWKGLANMGSAKETTIQATLRMIKERFGGTDEYVKKYMSLTDADIQIIRKNLSIQNNLA